MIPNGVCTDLSAIVGPLIELGTCLIHTMKKKKLKKLKGKSQDLLFVIGSSQLSISRSVLCVIFFFFECTHESILSLFIFRSAVELF